MEVRVSMAKGPEKKIQNAAIKYAESYGVAAIRLSLGPGVYTGWPDVLFLIPGGRPLFIEFKAPGKPPTPKQRARIDHLVVAGYDVEVCDNIEDANCIMQGAITATRLCS